MIALVLVSNQKILLRYPMDILDRRYKLIFQIRWSYRRLFIRLHNHNIFYRPSIEKMWSYNVSPRF